MLNLSPKQSSSTSASQRKYSLTFLLLGILLIGGIGLVIWASVSDLEESITGAGQIVPQGKLRRIMSPVTGLISDVHVQENDEVSEGDLLIELDPEIATSQTDSLGLQLDFLQQESMALRSAISGQGNTNDPVQNLWLESSRANYQNQLDALKAEINSLEHQCQQSRAEIAKTKELLDIDEEMLTEYRYLEGEGAISRNEFKEKESRTLEKRRDLASLQQQLKSRQASLQKSKKKYKQTQNAYKEQILSKLLNHQRDMLDLQGRLSQSQINLEHQVILAPIDSIVNEQTVRGPGEVVTTGDLLLTLVPKDSKLLAEVKVSNQDLSYIRIDQEANLRLDAFPYQQFGRLTGTVTSISPFTVKSDESGNNRDIPLFVVRIELEKTSFEKNGQQYRIKPGMTLTADIKTRNKKVIDYLLEPIKHSFDNAFKDPSTRF